MQFCYKIITIKSEKVSHFMDKSKCQHESNNRICALSSTYHERLLVPWHGNVHSNDRRKYNILIKAEFCVSANGPVNDHLRPELPTNLPTNLFD